MTFNAIKSKITEYDFKEFIADLKQAISYELDYAVSDFLSDTIIRACNGNDSTYSSILNHVENIITIVKLFNKESVSTG